VAAPIESHIHEPVEDRLQRQFIVRLGHRLVAAYTRHHHHITLLNPCPIPPTGPGILVCNHISGLDPVVLQSATPRLLTWMMAKEYYAMKSLRWFYQAIDAIPVERTGKDLAAMRSAFRALEQGRVIGLFAEGRISPTRDLLPFQTGIGLLALRSGAPVYPAFLEGSARGTDMLESFLFPQRLTLSFGAPLHFDRIDTNKSNLLEVTEAIRNAVLALQNRPDSSVGKLSIAGGGLSFY
jgi:1-acyl-sn-glycerol-3-phosphate acyltransferase